MSRSSCRVYGLVFGLVLVFGGLLTPRLDARSPVPPVTIPVEFEVMGSFLTSCPDFIVLEDFVVSGFVKFFHDSEGNPNRAQVHVQVGGVAYNGSDPSLFIDEKGAVENDQFDLITGEVQVTGILFHITIPGHGSVFMQSGNIRIDSQGNIVLQAGRNDFLSGETAEALCAALSP